MNDKGEFVSLANFNGAQYSNAKFNDTVVEVNPINPNQQVIRARDKQLLFDRILFKARSNKFNTGDLSNNVNWDGIQCERSKLNIMMKNQEAKMFLNFDNKGKPL